MQKKIQYNLELYRKVMFMSDRKDTKGQSVLNICQGKNEHERIKN